MPHRVVLGRIAGAHALRGEVRVQFFGDGPDNLLQASEVWLGEDRADPQARRYEVVASGTGRAGEVRLALSDVKDRDAADTLRGQLVLADPEQLAPLDEGEFYWHQLVGCEVFDTDGRRLGAVQEIWETGAHDVLVVASEDGGRHLLSTARELMPEVDLEARRIVVEILPGMLGPEAER
jgi:16S rRNA processing protein RimM